MRPEDGLVNHLFFVFAFSFLFLLGEHNKEKNVITRLINLRSLSFGPLFEKEKLIVSELFANNSFCSQLFFL